MLSCVGFNQVDFQVLFLYRNLPKCNGLWWSWSFGSWIYNYLCIQWLSQLTLCFRIQSRRGVLDTRWCDKFGQWLVASRWFSPGTPFSTVNKTDRHDIAVKLLMKVPLKSLTITKNVPNYSLSTIYGYRLLLSCVSSLAYCLYSLLTLNRS